MWKLSASSHMASLPFNNYFNTYYYNPKKFVTDTNSSKSSFTIEAILGINNHQNNHKNLLIVEDNNDYELNDIKLKNCICSDLSPKRSNYTNLYNVASVSPDSTAKEQNFSRYQTKNKTSSSHATSLHLNAKRSIDSVEITDAIRESKFSKSANKMDVGTRLAQSVASHAAHAKSKRVRTIFTPEQLERLETEFERQQYMVGPERLLLASALSLSEAQVKVWFQNRRIKWRKQHLEQQHARFSNLRQASNEAQDDITSDEEGEHDNLSVEESGIGSSTAIDNIKLIC